MLKRIRAWLIWQKMRRSYFSGDYERALRFADMLPGLNIDDPVLRALEATVGAMNGQNEQAMGMFKSLSREQMHRGSPNIAYVREYSLYQLALMRGDKLDSEQHRRTALALDASRLVKKELPIMDTPLPDDWSLR